MTVRNWCLKMKMLESERRVSSWVARVDMSGIKSTPSCLLLPSGTVCRRLRQHNLHCPFGRHVK